MPVSPRPERPALDGLPRKDPWLSPEAQAASEAPLRPSLDGGTELLLCLLCLKKGELRSPLLICRADNNSIQVFCMPGFQHPPVTYHWELKNTFLSDQPVVSIKGSLNPSEQITCTITTANSNASTSISVQKCYLSGITANGRNRRITRVLFIICVIVMVVVSWFLLYRKSALAAER